MGIWWRSGRKSAAAIICSTSRYNVRTPVCFLQRSILIKQEPHISFPCFHPHLDSHSFLPRSYAGLAKVKAKEVDSKVQAANEHNGPRLNAEITAPEVRLISEQGNDIISRREALTRAKKLKLDLVEVQHNASPPVCKIMDYNKERYNQRQREKERTKNKSELVLLKSECRQIRFTSKTEQKDLERKAEMGKRLLERGYRVKCLAMGSAQENLEELLSRISTLMEDYSIVEHGPKIDKKGASVILKHIKFGRAKKNEAQLTNKSIEISTNEMECVNSKETSEIENKKLDSVLFPEGAFERECSQFEEHARLEKFKEFSFEEVSTVDRIEGIPNADTLLEGIPSDDALLNSERNNKTPSLNEEFKEECVLIKEQVSTENLKDFAAEGVSTIDRVQEVPADFLLSSEKEMHTTYAFKEEPAIVNGINYIETKAKLGDSNGNHDAFDQPIETVSNTHSILHHHRASTTGKQFSSDPHSKQSLAPTEAKDCEILKQEHSALHMSANLSNGPAGEDALEKYKHKQSVLVNVSRQVMCGKNHRDQGHNVSNAEKPKSVDSVSESASGSISPAVEKEMHTTYAFKKEPVVVSRINYIETKAKLGDSNGKHDAFDQPIETLSNIHSILHHHKASNTEKRFPSDCHSKQSLGPTEAKDCEILKQEHSALHMSANLSNRPAEQDQLEKYEHKQSLPVNVSRQVMLGKIHKDHGCDVPNAEKPQSLDSVLKSASGSIMANAKNAIDDHNIHGSTASEITKTIFEDLQTPPIKLNLAAPSKGQQNTTNGTPKISAASLRQALVSRGTGNQEKTGKRSLADILPQKAKESRWAILKQVKSANFDGDKNSIQISEVTSNIVEELKISPANLNKVTAVQDSHNISVGSAQISTGGLRQVLVSSSSDDKKGASEIKSNTFETVQTSAIDLNNDAATQGQQNVAIRRHQIATEYRGQVIGNCSSNNQEIGVSERGKKPSIDTFFIKHSEPEQGRFKQIKQSNSEDKNLAENVQLEVSYTKHHVVSDASREDPPCTSHSNEGHDISFIRKQISLASESVPAKVSFETIENFPQGQLLAINANEDETTQSEIGVKDLKQAISSEHKNLPLSGVQVISNPMPRDSLEIPDTKNIPWDNGRNILTGENSIGQGKHFSVTGKQHPSISFSEQASVSVGSCWDAFSQPKSYIVETQRHPTKSTESQSIPSSFNNYKDATTTSAMTYNGDLKLHVPEKEKHTFTYIKPSHFKGNDNTATMDQPRVSYSEHHSNTDNTKQNHHSSNPPADILSNIEKKIPIASDSTIVNILEETYGKFSYGQSSAVDVNGASPMQTKYGVQNNKLTIPSEHKKQDLSGVRSILVAHSPKKEVTQKFVDSSPNQVSKTGVSNYGMSKQKPLSSVQASNTIISRDSLEIPNCDTIQWDDARKAPAVDSPRNQGSHASHTGKQSPIGSLPRQASVAGGSRWGIFSQQKGPIVQNQRPPVKMTQYQPKEPNTLRDTNIGASIETRSDAEPRHLHNQTQMSIPISGTGTPKQDLWQTENKAVPEPKQKGWGIFSKKVPTMHLDAKEKSEL